MATIRAHFDGKVIVPDEPVDLPVGQPLRVRADLIGQQPADESPEADRPLIRLLKVIESWPPHQRSGLPSDAAAQHDHYLYGTEKRDDP